MLNIKINTKSLKTIYKQYRIPLFTTLIIVLCIVLYLRVIRKVNLSEKEAFESSGSLTSLSLDTVVTKDNLETEVDKQIQSVKNYIGAIRPKIIKFETNLNGIDDDIDIKNIINGINARFNTYKNNFDTRFNDVFDTKFDTKFDEKMNGLVENPNQGLLNYLSETLDRPIGGTNGNKIIIDLEKDSDLSVGEVEYSGDSSKSGSKEIASSVSQLQAKTTISRNSIRKAIDYSKIPGRTEPIFKDNINQVAQSFVNSIRVLVTNLALTEDEVSNVREYPNIYKLWDSYKNLENNPVIKYMLQTADLNNRNGGIAKGRKRLVKNVNPIKDYFGLTIGPHDGTTAGVTFRHRDKFLNRFRDYLKPYFFLHNFDYVDTNKFENTPKFTITSSIRWWNNNNSNDYIENGQIKDLEGGGEPYTLTSKDKNYLIELLKVNNINNIIGLKTNCKGENIGDCTNPE